MQTLNVANENSTNTLRKDTVEPQQSVSSTQGTDRKTVEVDVSAVFRHFYENTEDFERKTETQIPEDVANMLAPQAELPEFEESARLKFALKAYDNEELSTRLAARFAGMSREEFIYTMGKYGLSPIRLTAEELRKDIESVRKASHQTNKDKS